MVSSVNQGGVLFYIVAFNLYGCARIGDVDGFVGWVGFQEVYAVNPVCDER